MKTTATGVSRTRGNKSMVYRYRSALWLQTCCKEGVNVFKITARVCDRMLVVSLKTQSMSSPPRAQYLVSISNKISYRKISLSLEAGRLIVWSITSLWNLTVKLCVSNPVIMPFVGMAGFSVKFTYTLWFLYYVSSPHMYVFQKRPWIIWAKVTWPWFNIKMSSFQ